MAIVQTGSILQFAGLGAANTGSITGIPVPVDAEFMVVGWSSYSGSTAFFSGGGMTFTKGGVDTAMTYAGGDNGSAGWSGPTFYLALPDTGSGKTLKWDWAGTGTASDASTLCSITFWKGVDTASPVRAAGMGSGGNTPYATGSLAGASGDLAVAWVGAFANAEGSIDSWSNLTTLSQITRSASADGAWATGSPTGSSTYAASTATQLDDGTITVIILKPASGGSVSLAATSNIKLQGAAASSLKASLGATVSVQIKLRNSMTGAVALSARSFLMAQTADLLTTTTALPPEGRRPGFMFRPGAGPMFMPRARAAFGPAAADPSVVTLFATSSIKISMAAGIAGRTPLAGRTGIGAAGRAGMSPKAQISARSTVKTSATDGMTARAGLAATSTVKASAKGPLAAIADMTASGMTMVRSRAAAAGKVALAARSLIAATGKMVQPGAIALMARSFIKHAASAGVAAKANLSATGSISARAKALAQGTTALAARSRIASMALDGLTAVAPLASIGARSLIKFSARAAKLFIPSRRVARTGKRSRTVKSPPP